MTRASTAIYDTRQKIFWSLFALLTVTFITYAFLLNKTIADAIYVEENQKEVIAKRSALSDLEREYLKKSAAITIENAHNLGFVDDNNASYIKTNTLSAEVSLISGNGAR